MQLNLLLLFKVKEDHRINYFHKHYYVDLFNMTNQKCNFLENGWTLQ